MPPLPESRQDALALDRDDPLAAARDLYALPEGVTYLDGHSLGPATHAAIEAVRRGASEAWAKGLIGSWNAEGWIDLPRSVAAKLAPLLGAAPDEVIVTDSVSVNLFKLAAAALPLAKGRVLGVEEDEFPTDAYVLDGLGALVSCEVRRLPSGGGTEFLALEGGVLVRSVVNYRTARLADMEAYEAAARQGGGLVVWDASHATGVVPLHLRARGARLAAGCTYKYLNGGPGAPAFVFVAEGLAGDLQTPIRGWFGHSAPFAFGIDYTPKEGAARFAAGTPPVLSLLALDAALDAFEGKDPAALWEKAGMLGDLCTARAEAMGFEILSPEDRLARGGHVTLRHDEGYPIVQALIARGIVGDFRAPDALRFGLSPLFLSHAELWDAMDQVQDVLASRAYDDPAFRVRAAVT